MTETYEYRFWIDAFTPATMPMARLAEYMGDLARLLGHAERVHFVRVEEGSVVLVQQIDREGAPGIKARIEGIGCGEGPPDAQRALRALDQRLAQDDAIGVLLEPSGAEIIRFLGRERSKPIAYGSFRQQGSIDGILVRIGGKDESAHATLVDGDVGRRCQMTREMAMQMAPHLFGAPLRVFGEGRWRRMPDGVWELEQFTVSHFEVLDDTSLPEVVARLRGIEGNQWKTLDDPLEEWRRIREGPDEAG